GVSIAEAIDGSQSQTDRYVIEFLRQNHPKADEIEAAYEDSWIPDYLHIDRTDLHPDLPDSPDDL
ncbi:hypothetical protein ACFQDD_02055, partial [Halorubrum pallidum]